MKKSLLCLLVAPTLLGLASCGHNSSATPDQKPGASAASEIEVSEKYGDIQALTRMGDCRAALTYRPVEPYTMKFDDECAQPLVDKLNLLGAMIERLFGPAGPPSEMTSLFVGLLDPTFPEIGQRVVLASADRSERKYRKAVELNQINRYYAEIAGDKDNYPELQELFSQWGFDVVGVSVEKVMVGTPSQTPFASLLVEQGIKSDRQIPYDALTWFKLKKQAAPKD